MMFGDLRGRRLAADRLAEIDRQSVRGVARFGKGPRLDDRADADVDGEKRIEADFRCCRRGAVMGYVHGRSLPRAGRII